MAVNNSLVAKQNQRLGITAYLTNDAVKNQINQVIGGKDGTKFISAVVSAVNNNPALQECTNQSILSAALLGESLGRRPQPPRRDADLVGRGGEARRQAAEGDL